MRRLKVLVCCEESQRVCCAFRSLGHYAFSCDIKECSGGHPEWHIKDDCLKYINGASDDFSCPDLLFRTQDNSLHILPWKWDIVIAHPPCTYFSNATMVNLGRKDLPDIFNDMWRANFYTKRSAAFDFVKKIWSCNCDFVAVENVVGYLSTHFAKPSQIIQPFMFGQPFRKATCLWLRGLPLLTSTDVVVPTCKWVRHTLKTGNDLVGYSKKGVYSAAERSKTFEGVANAMALQWSRYVIDFLNNKE